MLNGVLRKDLVGLSSVSSAFFVCKIYNSVLGLLILPYLHCVNVTTKTNPNTIAYDEDTKTLDKLFPLPPDLYMMMVVKQVVESPPWPC